MKGNNKGFSLVELLAVILIMGILMVLAVPAINSQISKSRSKAFYTSVSNIVRQVKLDTMGHEKECTYSYENRKSNIGDLLVWIHYGEDGQMIYSVRANRVGRTESDNADIDIYDFSKTEFEEKTWVGKGNDGFTDQFNNLVVQRMINVNSERNSFLDTAEDIATCYLEDSKSEVAENEED